MHSNAIHVRFESKEGGGGGGKGKQRWSSKGKKKRKKKKHVQNSVIIRIKRKMEICKAPTLRLKALNKHTHIMFIEKENVIKKKKRRRYLQVFFKTLC